MSCNDHPVLVFDGVCNLCDRSVRFVLRHDKAGRFRFTANQSPAGRDLLRRHGLDPDAVDSLVLIRGGEAFMHSEAVRRIGAALPPPWRYVAALARLIPRAIRDPIYRFIARRRYRWFGRREQCMMPDPQVADRFYDQSIESGSPGDDAARRQ